VCSSWCMCDHYKILCLTDDIITFTSNTYNIKEFGLLGSSSFSSKTAQCFSNMFLCSYVLMCSTVSLFLCVQLMSIISVMVPDVCLMFNIWLEYPKLLLLFLNACICSFYLVWNVLPVCPMYFSVQSRHFIG
jgi:hypothetical protein